MEVCFVYSELAVELVARVCHGERGTSSHGTKETFVLITELVKRASHTRSYVYV